MLTQLIPIKRSPISKLEWNAGVPSDTDKLELNAGFKFMDIAEESDTVLVLDAMYDFGKAFSAGVSYARADDTRTITVSGLYYF